MVSLSNAGMLLASKGAEGADEDEDMDDFIRPDDEDMDMDDKEREEKRRKKYAHLLFSPFNTWKNLKGWHFSLKHGEQVECVAIGSGWCAAATDFGYVRVFSIEGVQRTILTYG